MEVKYRIIEAILNDGKKYYQAQMYRMQPATWFKKEKEVFDTFGDWYETFEEAKQAIDNYRNGGYKTIIHEID